MRTPVLESPRPRCGSDLQSAVAYTDQAAFSKGLLYELVTAGAGYSAIGHTIYKPRCSDAAPNVVPCVSTLAITDTIRLRRDHYFCQTTQNIENRLTKLAFLHIDHSFQNLCRIREAYIVA